MSINFVQRTKRTPAITRMVLVAAAISSIGGAFAQNPLLIPDTLSGEVMQKSNTCNLIFKIPDLIAHLSSVFTLEPGDIISTGTPAGVGVARRPPRFLRAGDVVTVRIEGIGELTNPVVAEE